MERTIERDRVEKVMTLATRASESLRVPKRLRHNHRTQDGRALQSQHKQSSKTEGREESEERAAKGAQ